MTFAVAQLGARMHYAIPLLLESKECLECFFTDLYSDGPLRSFSRSIPMTLQPKLLRRWMGRHCEGLPVEKVKQFPLFGFGYLARRRSIRTTVDALETWVWAGETFCKRVLGVGFGNASHIYTFNSAGLELMEHAKSRGLVCIMEQTIAPKAVEFALLKEAQQRHPEWAIDEAESEALKAFISREEKEWGLADLILCGSEFVVEGIKRRGGPAEKCRVVPYGIQQSNHILPKVPHEGPLRFLFAGAVGLRKGAPAVIEVAKLLGKKIQIRMVGPLDAPKNILAELSKWVEFTGAVPRSEMPNHFQWADVFLLPSWCEGSATVTYEALSFGLPVICTPNAGSLVRDGKDGWLVAPDDVDAITQRISTLANSPQILESMRQEALQVRQNASMDAYGIRLMNALSPLMVPK